MRRIGIISDVHDWHSDQIELNLKKYNCKVFRINFDELIFSLKKKILFLNDNKINKLVGCGFDLLTQDQLRDYN